MHRTFLLLWILFAVTASAAVERKPNVIFFLADDQGWADAAAWGHPYVKTPNMDRLTRGGTRVSQFYVANPVCSPSRTAFMTGSYPARHRIHGHLASHDANVARVMPDWLDPNVPTVADQLKAVGYATGHYGKWHLGGGTGAPLPAEYGLEQSRTLVSADTSLTGSPVVKQPHWWGHSTEVIVNDALNFIRQHREQPFYLNIWTLLPHATLDPTPEQLAVYDQLLPAADHPAFGKWAQQYYGEAKDLRQQMKVFLASLTDLDTQLGRLLDELQTLGLSKDTLIIYSSDNGPEDHNIRNASNAGVGSPGPLRARKRSIYEGGVRVPFVAHWPGHISAGVFDESSVIGSVDLLPTLCAITGAALPANAQLDGEDVSDILLTGASRARTRPLFWDWRSRVAGDTRYAPPPVAVRLGQWKLFTDVTQSRVELYDIPADPGEHTNQAAAHPDVVARLSKLALEWKATLPVGEERVAASAPKASGGEKSASATKPGQREVWWKEKDANHDGKMSLEEFLHNFPDQDRGKSRFAAFDVDHDGYLSEPEFVRPQVK
jgi:arylsulfatase A-like enzyme